MKTADELDVAARVQTSSPDDVERRAFFAASLGMLRTIRMILLVVLALELLGRIVQVAYIVFPGFGAH